MKNNLYSEFTKNNNAAVAMSKSLYDANGVNKSINSEKGRRKGIEDLLNCALTLLIFISSKPREFSVTKNETPKMVKVSNCTKKLSRNFAEHVQAVFTLNMITIINFTVMYNYLLCQYIMYFMKIGLFLY